MEAGKFRGWIRILLLALGVLLLLAGTLLAYVGAAVADESGFVRRVTESLRDERVSAYAAQEIVDALIEEQPDLVAVRPLLAGTVQALISSEVARTVIGTGARAAHHLLFTDVGEDLLFTLEDVNVLVRSTLAQSHPALAQRLPESLTARLEEEFALKASSEIAGHVVRAAQRSRRWGIPLLVSGALLLGFATSFRVPLSRGFIRLGVVLVASGMSLDLVRRGGGAIVASASRDPAPRDAIMGVWDAFLLGLSGWVLALAALGLLLLAVPLGVALRSGTRPVLARVWRWLRTERPGPGHRGARALGLVALGGVLVVYPGAVLSLLAAGLGATVGFAGLVEGFAVLLVHVRGLDVPGIDEIAGQVRAQLKVGAGIVLGTMGALVAAALAVVPSYERMWLEGSACNGAVALCSVPLDRVVFPTTHNSMAAGDEPGWLIPNHEVGIGPQLADGVRGLMIDVFYGAPAQGRVLTELADEAKARAVYERVVGREGVEAALRIRGRLLGESTGPRALYMCHGFCELGATPLDEGLRTIARFLRGHPREVLVIVVQDDPVDPRDFAEAVAHAELLPHVYRGPVVPPLPTLGELIDRDERVLFLSEAHGGVVPWYHAAYEGLLEETPYHFESAEQLSCAPHRGGDHGALFLLNHWITAPPAPLPSRAALMNSEPFLLRRIAECERARGRLPNLVAVDFYRTGDLLRVVRRLNERALDGSASAVTRAR